MPEIELKTVVDDVDRCRRLVEEAGGTLVFMGRLEDRRYDTPARFLGGRDEVLRVRVYRNASGARAELAWKGPASQDSGYKTREELQTGASDPDTVATILQRLGFVVTRAIDRDIVQYDLLGAMVRFERYPRMDVLLEVEGTAEGIERAIVATAIPRARFSSDRLRTFVERYQQRTGHRAALCDVELGGTYPYRLDDV